jgi:single-strand DNA-binding protein
MKSLKNKVTLIGHLGKDVELKEFESGTKMARVSLATNEFFKNSNGEKVQETQWHNVVAWNKVAENLKDLCEKGTEIAVEGKLTYRDWEDKEGQKRYATEVVVSEFMKLTPKTEALPF